jgi:thiol-disulfide isomerase/thioredoxin
MRIARGALALLAMVAYATMLHAAAAPRTLAQACPLLSTSPLASSRLAALPAGTLLRAGPVTITTQAVDSEIAKAAPDVAAELKRSRLYLLEQLATKRLVSFEAGQWAKATNRVAKEAEAARAKAYLQSVVAGVTVTDADLRGFYEENRSALGDMTFEQAEPQFRGYVLLLKREAAQQQYLNALSERVDTEVAEAWVKTNYRLLVGNPVDRARLSGRPSLVDFGAGGCVACETMSMILDPMADELAGKANVLFVDVRKQQVLGSRFGVRTIPLQVFFDRDGKEVFRHTGVFPEAKLKAKLAELGVK